MDDLADLRYGLAKAAGRFFANFSAKAKAKGLPQEKIDEVKDYLFFAGEHMRLDDWIGAKNAVLNARGVADLYLKS